MKEEDGIILITESRSLALLFQRLMTREFNNNSYNNVMVLLPPKMGGRGEGGGGLMNRKLSAYGKD